MGRSASLIEIDLLRGGQRMPMLDPWPDGPYFLMVARARKAPERCHVYPGHFRTPLPQVPVPLVKPEADLVLDLQPLVEDIYLRSRYDHNIDYDKPLENQLASDDAAWLQQQLRLAKA